MATATARVTRTRIIAAPRAEVWACMADLDLLGGLIDALEEVRPLDGGGHQFLLTPIHALGQRFRPGAQLQVEFMAPERVTFTPVAESASSASADGSIALTPSDDATHVQMSIDVRLELSLPRLFSGPASAVLAHELRVAFDGFLVNLDTAATRPGA